VLRLLARGDMLFVAPPTSRRRASAGREPEKPFAARNAKPGANSGDGLPAALPAPQGEQATARKDQAGQPSTNNRAGNADGRI